MLGQKDLKTCKNYERTMPKQMEIWNINYNIKLMNFLRMQQNDPKIICILSTYHLYTLGFLELCVTRGLYNY